MFLAAAALAGFLPACVPARWFSGDPKSLDLLTGSPISCLLVEPRHWTPQLVAEAHRRGLKMLATTADHPDADALVYEGYPPPSWQPPAGKPVVILASREHVRASAAIAGTNQGLWPGIRIDDKVIATPTTAPWIDTNLGFLRYLAAQHPETLWIANRPPPGNTITLRGYEKALVDAALAGARWVITVRDDFATRLLAGDRETRREWEDLMKLDRFIESQPRLRNLVTYSKIGVSVNRETGAFVSGGVLDMIGAQHIPFHLAGSGATFQLFFDFADNGIVKFPQTSLGRISMRPGDADQLEVLYRRVQVTVGSTNYGLRVFNGVGLLSTAATLPEHDGVVVFLANYTDYPAEDITLHVLGNWKKATLETPDAGSQELTIYAVKESTAVEVPKLVRFGVVRVVSR
jgi:hypothetical protein